MEVQEKRVYETPELTEHGEIEKLTMAISPVGQPDGATVPGMT